MTDKIEFPLLAERLDGLMCERKQVDGSRWTARALADYLSDRGVPVTHSYLSRIRAGKAHNPSALLVAGLAKCFDVPVSYLLATKSGDSDVVGYDGANEERQMLVMGRLTDVETSVRELVEMLKGDMNATCTEDTKGH